MSEGKIHNKVVVVNEQDEVVGSEMMFSAIEKGMIRRASRIFLFNQSGKLLVQRRSKSVSRPLLLDQSVGGHVDEGESYQQAAERELFEELGIKDVELEEIITSFRTEYFYNAIYKIVVSDDIEINIDTEEVAEVIWFDISELENKFKNEPDNFTVTFPEIWFALRDKLIA